MSKDVPDFLTKIGIEQVLDNLPSAQINEEIPNHEVKENVKLAARLFADDWLAFLSVEKDKL